MGFFTIATNKETMRSAFLGLLFVAMRSYRCDATVGITVVSGASTVLALTATQVTALAALKALALSKGVLLGAAVRRGRRQAVDNNLNIVGTGSEDLVSALSRSEVEQCTQLLFSSKAAHLVGQQSGPEKCVASYDCSLTVPDIIQF